MEQIAAGMTTRDLRGVKEVFKDVAANFVKVETALKAGGVPQTTYGTLGTMRISLEETLSTLRELTDLEHDIVHFMGGEMPAHADAELGEDVSGNELVSDAGFAKAIAAVAREHNDLDRLASLCELMQGIRRVLSACERRSAELADDMERCADDADAYRTVRQTKEGVDAAACVLRRRLDILAERYFLLRKKVAQKVVDSSRRVLCLFAEGDDVTRQFSFKYDVSGPCEELGTLDGKFRNRPRTATRRSRAVARG